MKPLFRAQLYDVADVLWIEVKGRMNAFRKNEYLTEVNSLGGPFARTEPYGAGEQEGNKNISDRVYCLEIRATCRKNASRRRRLRQT